MLWSRSFAVFVGDAISVVTLFKCISPTPTPSHLPQSLCAGYVLKKDPLQLSTPFVAEYVEMTA